MNMLLRFHSAWLGTTVTATHSNAKIKVEGLSNMKKFSSLVIILAVASSSRRDKISLFDLKTLKRSATEIEIGASSGERYIITPPRPFEKG